LAFSVRRIKVKNTLYICFSESVKRCLRYGIPVELRHRIKVINFLDDLSNGPIDDMGNIDRRIEWDRRIIPSKFDDLLDNIRENYSDINREVSNIKDEDIYIWYGENGSEMTGLLYILSLLKDKVENVYTINVSEKPFIYVGTVTRYRSAGEVSPERLEWFIGMKKKLGLEGYVSLMGLWTKLQQENCNLRVVKDRNILSVPESYFDEIILKYTNRYFSKCARTVGEVIGRNESYISDFFLFWRILELIKSGRIEYRGELGNMRDMEIRKSSVV
jgi:hypothetical protein